MKKKKCKNRKILRMPMTLFIIGILLVVGVSGALLTYFGVLTQTVTVNKAVELTGDGCEGGVCSETSEISGGETINSADYTAKSDTSVDGVINLDTECTASETPNSCEEATTKPIFKLSIPTATEPNSVQDRVVAKTNTDANSINTLDFKYKLTTTTTKYSPYFVLAFDTDNDDVVDAWAVSLQDTANDVDTWYTHGDGLSYHNVGTCTQSDPCNLEGLKGQLVLGSKLLQVKVMIGYWGDMTATTALVKDININGEDVTGNGLIVRHHDDADPDDLEYGESKIDFNMETEFPFEAIPAVYTVTTEIVPQ